MNPIKWLVCWFYKRHVPIVRTEVSEHGTLVRVGMCARCGTELWRA